MYSDVGLRIYFASLISGLFSFARTVLFASSEDSSETDCSVPISVGVLVLHSFDI